MHTLFLAITGGIDAWPAKNTIFLLFLGMGRRGVQQGGRGGNLRSGVSFLTKSGWYAHPSWVFRIFLEVLEASLSFPNRNFLSSMVET